MVNIYSGLNSFFFLLEQLQYPDQRSQLALKFTFNLGELDSYLSQEH